MSELEKVGFFLNYDFIFAVLTLNLKVIVFVMDARLTGNVCRISKCKYSKVDARKVHIKF